MRVHLVNWIVKCRKWIKQISKDILNMKNWKLSDYLNDLVQLNFKLHEIALMIYVHIYHMNLGVVLHKSYWCAAIHDDIFKAKVSFAFKGKLQFLNMPYPRVFQVREKTPEKSPKQSKEKSPEHGRTTKNSLQAGWFTKQEWNNLFDPHVPKVPPPPHPLLPPSLTPYTISPWLLKTLRRKQK